MIKIHKHEFYYTNLFNAKKLLNAYFIREFQGKLIESAIKSLTEKDYKIDALSSKESSKEPRFLTDEVKEEAMVVMVLTKSSTYVQIYIRVYVYRHVHIHKYVPNENVTSRPRSS